jgi:hypothetical protein
MKTLFVAVSMLCAMAGSKAFAKSRKSSFEIKIGIVDRFLTGKDGNITGILLNDDTQVAITQKMADTLIKVIKPDDIVTVKGYRQSSRLMTADTIVNTSTGTAQPAGDDDHTENEMAAKVSERPGAL